ncbi:type ISP restriction/modification enzyme [Helicobacter pametensis]|uniref:type ISP restriction/modification enzyme n=1 Tax=Helicobacter pametensis TaxID=95149 RepID=UPI0004B5BD17|nr:type ISP restriction/modification enzyme [Helicobacter pametensis]
MQEALINYLNAIKSISPKDKEHTHRGALQTLIQAFADVQPNKNLKIIHEPNNDKEGRGAPDFLITQNSLTLGYIENKRVNINLQEISQSDQILKYTKLSPNIMLTDYLSFALVRLDDKANPQIYKEFRICFLDEIPSILKHKATLAQKAQELQDLFSIFFSHAPTPISSAQEFATALSLRTRLLKDDLLSKEDDKIVLSLFCTFKDVLYKDLTFQDFCDSFAQTLTYSLFLAKLNSSQDEHITLFNTKSFIPKSFPLIRAMSGFLDNLDELDSIKWLIKEIIAIINHIDISTIISELNKISEKNLLGEYIHKDPYLHFYETFLASYDPKLRELRGVYYTPAPVVDFIINSIDFILKTTFKQKEGLAQALTNPNITLLDFATGTGTFLLEAFRKALQNTPKNSPRYNPKALLSRFCGFEFLIAPYTIAHLKLSQTFKEEFGTPLEENESLNIALTNTLYNLSLADEETSRNPFAGMLSLEEEYKKAQGIKEQEILIITGNPPYSGASGNKGLYEYEIRTSYGLEPSKQNLEDFQQVELKENLTKYNKLQYDHEKQTQHQDFIKAKRYLDKLIKERKLENEKNPKWLLDDYVKFIRFAESKIASQESGIFAFISNNGFLDNPTFRGMRYALMQTFDTIYILDLHGNARKKEQAPDGSKDDNVFDIMQGVSINILIKSPKKPKLPQILHYDLYGKRTEKYRFLLENSLEGIPWTSLAPKEPHYLFIPQDEELKLKYDKGVSVKDMFRISSVGIVGGRDNFVFSKNASQDSLKNLKDNIRLFMDLEIEEARKQFDLGADSRDWQIQFAKKELQKTQNDASKYIQVQYRPFDMRWTYYTGKSKGFHCMPRGEVMEHFLNKENFGLNVARQFRLEGKWCAVTMVDTIMDFSMMGGGNTGAGTIFPLYLYPTDRIKKKEKTLFDKEMEEERVENFTQKFREKINALYQEHFSPEVILGYIYAVLFHRGYRERYIEFLKIDFPKIPFVEDKKVFLKLSELGEKLISLHLLRDADLDPSIGEPLYIDPKSKNLTIEQSKYLQSKIFVNPNLYFDRVSLEVWEYKIGGYQVLDKYLKSHKGEEIDFDHFQKIIQTLTTSLEIEEQISKIDIGVWE